MSPSSKRSAVAASDRPRSTFLRQVREASETAGRALSTSSDGQGAESMICMEDLPPELVVSLPSHSVLIALSLQGDRHGPDASSHAQSTVITLSREPVAVNRSGISHELIGLGWRTVLR